MKKILLVLLATQLTACIFLPQNNDKIVPADTPKEKIVTLIQKDSVVRINALNRLQIRTTLVIDGEEVTRFYFGKSEIIRRYPEPKTIWVKCSTYTEEYPYGVVKWNNHPYEGKIEEGKTYTFQCKDLDTVDITEFKNLDLVR